MKIKKLIVKNAIGIEELNLEPGNVTMIQGGSEQGKTSILDILEKGLNNTCKRAKFVRQGETEAYINIEIEPDISVTRKVREGKSDFVKVTKGGIPVTSPESFLKSLTNGYAFSPVSFLNLTDKQQTDILLSMIPLEITSEMVESWFNEMPPTGCAGHGLTALKSIERYYFDKRTETSRDLKTTQTQLATSLGKLPVNYNPAEWENVSLKGKYEAITAVKASYQAIEDNRAIVESSFAEITKTNEFYDSRLSGAESDKTAQIEKAKNEMHDERRNLELSITELQQKIAELEADKNALDSKLNTNTTVIEERCKNRSELLEKERKEKVELLGNKQIQAQTFLSATIDLPDVSVLETEAAQIEEMKGFLQYHRDMKELEAKQKRLLQTTENLNAKIATARTKPAELLAEMEMPISGLGINDEAQITIDDLPIKNLSTSRQVQLSLEIARATAGELKLICVDQFETLDADRRAEFLKAIENDGYSYFITQVTNGDLEITTGGE